MKPMTPSDFEAQRKFIDTPSGRIAYVEQGRGPVALFVHGVLVNGYLWRHQLAELSGMRRCIAVDLLAHGATEISPGQDVSSTANAQMLAQFLDAMDIEKVDLVGNDSGGGMALIFAARHPQRVRSLALTDCDTHDNWPPEAFKPFLALSAVSDDTIEAYLRPHLASAQRTRDLERFLAAFDCAHTVAVEAKLKTLTAPTLIVWGTDDVYFDVKWSHRLAETIPGTRRRVEFDGARLFFPEERAEAFNAELRGHWAQAAAA
jgi:pimeloyl-ACP methyl ester carboxylesterase